MTRRQLLEEEFDFLTNPIRAGVDPGPCQWCGLTPTVRHDRRHRDDILWTVIACKPCFVRWSEHLALTGTIMADGGVTMLHLLDVMRELIQELQRRPNV